MAGEQRGIGFSLKPDRLEDIYLTLDQADQVQLIPVLHDRSPVRFRPLISSRWAEPRYDGDPLEFSPFSHGNLAYSAAQ